jgi:hypothetical protein
VNASGKRDPLDGDETPIDPARIGSALVEGVEGTAGAPRSVTSMDAVRAPVTATEPTDNEESES